MSPENMVRSAAFSDDGKNRYELVRDWSGGAERKICVFAMLNPSDAGAEKDDPTSRKMVGFASRWGYNVAVGVNLTAEISTDPWGLSPWRGLDPVNTKHQRKWINLGALIVAAWGSQPRGVCRTIAMAELIHSLRGLAAGKDLYCIGETKSGDPLHPSRAPYTNEPFLWRERE